MCANYFRDEKLNHDMMTMMITSDVVAERVHEKEKNVCFGNYKRVQTIIGAETWCI